MSLGPAILKKINQKFEPDSTQSLRFKGYDLVLIVDKKGQAVQLYLGEKNAEGKIRGDRYARTLKYDRSGVCIKDHWELKGKAT